jgi:DNA-binding CsgD family transcriptional regulator
MKKQSFEYDRGELPVLDEQTSAIVQYLDMISSPAVESIYMLDLSRKQFCYVKSGGLFLCGCSVEDAVGQGYDFYSKIVHPDDLYEWTVMRKAVLRYLNNYEEKQDEIAYFFCTFRLQCRYSFLPRPLPQMIYQRMKPVWVGGELRYLVCTAGVSTVKESGILRMYSSNGRICEDYIFKAKRWNRKTEEPITECERVILMLARQGKSSLEIAGDMDKKQGAVRNQIKALFAKLNVQSMQEAIEVAYCHRMINHRQDKEPEESQPVVEAPRKEDDRVLLPKDMLQRII